jgi:hypothetical protein
MPASRQVGAPPARNPVSADFTQVIAWQPSYGNPPITTFCFIWRFLLMARSLLASCPATAVGVRGGRRARRSVDEPLGMTGRKIGAQGAPRRLNPQLRGTEKQKSTRREQGALERTTTPRKRGFFYLR